MLKRESVDQFLRSAFGWFQYLKEGGGGGGVYEGFGMAFIGHKWTADLDERGLYAWMARGDLPGYL